MRTRKEIRVKKQVTFFKIYANSECHSALEEETEKHMQK